MSVKSFAKKSALLVMVLMVLVCAGCGRHKTLDEITITYVKSPLNVPSMVERNLGIFSKHFGELGIRVNYAEITSGSEQIQALESGDVQILNCVGATSVIIGKANGADVQILNMYGSSPRAYQMYTGDSSIQKAEDLRGKRIGGPKGTTLHELLSAYLQQNGMSLEDVEYVTLSVADAFAALEAGQIDVAMLAGATAYQAQAAGYTCLATGEGLTNGTTLVAVSGLFASDYPELVEVFQRAQQEVLAYIENNPEEARKIAAEETGLSADAIEVMYQQYRFYMEPAQADREGLAKTIQFLLETDMIETAPEISFN